MDKISSYLENVKSVGIAGHVNPDGDCVGSTVGMYLYMKENYPEIAVDLYLETIRPDFMFLKGANEYKNTYELVECTTKEDSFAKQDTTEKAPEMPEECGKIYDLFITLDVSTKDRIGVAGAAFDRAKKTICIDHHVSNKGFAMVNHIVPDASSASEVLYKLFDEEKVSKSVAEAIYLGIVHDSGVFQYSSTSPDTMRIAAKLMEKGIDFSRIVEETYYQKTYLQQQITGRTLLESIRLMNGKCIAGIVTQKIMDFYGVTKQDLDGIVAQLRLTKGVEVAIFIYEIGSHEYKVSLRSNGAVDVNKVASAFGGGGHVKAAGCTMHGGAYDVINNLTYHIEKQMADHEA